ncbi:MAG: hypothetical protein ABFS21_05770 [Actinomycetota bacterium]
MKTDEFRQMLAGHGLDDEQIAERENGVRLLDAHLARLPEPTTIDACTDQHVSSFVSGMMEQGLNEWGTFVGVYLYAGMIGNYDAQLAMLDRLNGFEILERLHRAVGEELGESVREEVFAGVELPPLGSTPLEWTRANAVVFPRLEAVADADTVKRILRSGLRNLSDATHLPAKERYEEIGDLDAFLEDRGRRRIEELEKHRDEGTPYYELMIDDSVIDFVRANPQICGGIRRGNMIIETKIPREAIEYVKALDLAAKQYRACHCPVVRESMVHDDLTISDTFCEFCPSFNAKPWEVIFGQKLDYDVLESAMRGSDRCTFAIHLPETEIS